MYGGNGRAALTAGIFLIIKLATAPTIARPTRIAPTTISFRKNRYDSTPPATVPKITARNDSDSRMPLPFDNWSGGKISGITPYFAGTKNAEWVPIRKTQPSTSHDPSVGSLFRPSQKPSIATSVIPTSANFQMTRAFRFEYLSARYPAMVQKIPHGA